MYQLLSSIAKSALKCYEKVKQELEPLDGFQRLEKDVL